MEIVALAHTRIWKLKIKTAYLLIYLNFFPLTLPDIATDSATNAYIFLLKCANPAQFQFTRFSVLSLHPYTNEEEFFLKELGNF